MHKIIILGLFNSLNTITEEEYNVQIKKSCNDINKYLTNFIKSTPTADYFHNNEKHNFYLLTDNISQNLLKTKISQQFFCNFLTTLEAIEVKKLFISYNKEDIYTDIVKAYIYLHQKIILLFPKYSYEAILMTEYDLIREILKFDCVENNSLDNSCWKNKRINKIIMNDKMLSLRYKSQKISYNDCFSVNILNNNSIYEYTPITINNCLFIDTADVEFLIIFEHIINILYTEFIKDYKEDTNYKKKKEIYEDLNKKIKEKMEKEKNEAYNCSVQ